MSDVVLRCPNCGTTQAMPGECEACHEADVRFYCPNHTPGRWLDGPLCAECALRAKRERSTRPTPPRRNDPPLEAPIETPRRTPARPPRFEEEWREAREPVPLDPLKELGETLGRYIEAAPRVRINPAPVFGCIGQLFKLAIFLFILFAMATCWYFSGGGIVIGERSAPVDSARYGQDEPAADTERTLRGEVAPHPPREIATDREAEPRAFMRTRQVGTHLDERIENRVEFVGRDADAGVGDDDDRVFVIG